MLEWWSNLSDLQRFFAYVAIPSTIILVIQTILNLLGLADIDTDVDVDIDNIAGLKFFSIKGIVAFCAVFGWIGIMLLSRGTSEMLTFFISTAGGLGAMFAIALMFYGVSKLQSSGNINYKNALNKTGEVYMPIPPKRQGMGKISILIQERLTEVNAVTDEEETINTGEIVKVVGNLQNNVVLVVPEKAAVVK